MKRIIALFLILVLFTFISIGCNAKTPEGDKQEVGSKAIENNEEKQEAAKTNKPITLKVSSPGGPLTVSLVKMFKERPFLGENIEVNYESVNSPDIMASKIISGETDFAVIPTNLAAKLYNKGVQYKLAASTVWGVLYIVSSEEISSWGELKGKEIYTIGRGLTPDILFRYLSNKNGLNANKDITINYLSSPQELAGFMITGKAKVAIIPEPILSSVLIKNQDVKIVLDLQKEWENMTGKASYPQSSIFIKTEVLEKYPDVVDEFLSEYEKSIKWVNEKPAQAGKYVEELNIGLNAKIVEKAIPGSNLNYVEATDAKEAVEEFLKVLNDFSKESIGGKLPDNEFYYKR